MLTEIVVILGISQLADHAVLRTPYRHPRITTHVAFETECVTLHKEGAATDMKESQQY